MLLKYDYSKSSDPLQPLAAHLISLLGREHPKTTDITVHGAGDAFHLHKFILSARSPYFRNKLAAATETTTWRLPPNIPPQAFGITIKHLYFGELPRDLGSSGSGYSDSDILAGIGRISKHLEIPELTDAVLESGDRRLARQRRSAELERGRDQLLDWFQDNITKHKVVVDASKAQDVKWDRENGIFADVLLCAVEPTEDEAQEDFDGPKQPLVRNTPGLLNGIPVGPSQMTADAPTKPAPKAILFPVHRAMLIRSEFFLAMFSSAFREAQESTHLQVVNVDCPPDVLEYILTFLYTEDVSFPVEISIDVLLASDLLMIEKLKAKAAVVISNLCNSKVTQMPIADSAAADEEDDGFDIYTIIRVAWATRVQRLEESSARYLAYHLEKHIDTPEFAELIEESATRIQKRQETDSIEVIDDIRYYLSERFRLRFEDAGLEDMLDDELDGEAAAAVSGFDGGNLDEAAAKEAPGSGPQDANEQTINDRAIAEAKVEGNAIVRTLDGDDAGDEFAEDAMNYQILLGKIDTLLDKLSLDG